MDFRLAMAVWVLAFLNPSHSSSSIQITDLQHNPGLLALDMGKSFVRIGKHRLYHVVDLKQCEPIFARLDVAIHGLKSFGNLSDLTAMLESKFSNTRKMFQNLMPRQRNKRGLLNFVGSAIKQITGNLDNDDLIEISKTLKALEIDDKILINENNEQARINTQLQDRLNKFIEQFEFDHNLIRKNLIAAKSNSGIDKTIKLLREILKINIQLDNLESHLKLIFESIQLAKLNTIPRDILSPDELSIILDHFTNHKIIIDSIDQVYQFLNLSAFYNHTKIVFIVEIPLLDELAYRTLLLEPLIVKNKTLKLPAHAAITNDQQFYFIIEECQRVGHNQICHPENLNNFTLDGCFPYLLKGIPANCSFKEVSLPSEIKSITDNHLIAKQINSQEIATTCGMRNRTLSGTFLIEYHNCTIIINGLEFTNKEWYKVEPLLVVPMDGLEIQTIDIEPQISFEKLHFINRHHLETLNSKTNVTAFTSISLSSISLIIATIAIFFLISRKFSNHWNHHNKKPSSGHRVEFTANEDVSIFKEGQVTDESSQISRLQELEREVHRLEEPLATLFHSK
ncbi:uncharacterized protein LOC129733840 isoform X2 [Wyeomyia smithii]|uniref:uncharacterized protein LOC129724835 n=1 Tax=Wyeomyia smithii TaxID=174621 RepID=UPI00246817F3|nr:uncharacterized protein LOC129724835 [Wyeomyia smithii]XP_055551354.1 uncharacterized protein LOC129733840 isoform X2 [Wyeomyia smithii]